jgi:uncharacterized protein (TIGR03435 family)
MTRIAVLGFLAGTLFAQANDPAVTFEAASIKPFVEGSLQRFSGCQGGPGSDDPGRVECEHVTLKMLLMRGYQMKSQEIFGPAWLETERFNITAKVPHGATKDQVAQMFQHLLADRFSVSLHREKRLLPVYAIEVSKGGLKIQQAKPSAAGVEEAAPAGPPPKGSDGFPILRPSVYAGGAIILYRNGRARLQAGGIKLGVLADTLSSQLDRVVVDETALSGKYDIRLDWTPDASEPGGRPHPADEAASPEPDLFVALDRQLGLRMSLKKVERDALVVDRAEKTPREN